MDSPNQGAVLAWSKTIDGVRFRAFAFPEGCDDPNCPVCGDMSENGPVWAVFMRPRQPADDEQLDEWCLCLLAWGPNELAHDDRFAEGIKQLHMAEEFQQQFWRKVSALVGVKWTTVVERPYEFAVRHKKALDEVMNEAGLVGQLVKASTPEQLREVRDTKRDGEGFAFGEAFGRLFWQMVGRFRDERRGS